jgi:hypothetical protein
MQNKTVEYENKNIEIMEQSLTIKISNASTNEQINLNMFPPKNNIS